MTTVRIRTLSGSPIERFPDDYPFRVEVTIPRDEDEDPPETITITIETEDDSEELEIAWTGNTRGDPEYKSNPITLEGGAVGGGKVSLVGFEFTTGGMDGMDTEDGEEVTISYDGESATANVYESWYTLAFVELRRFFDMAEAFWKTVLEQLKGRRDKVSRDMVALAEKKLRLIARGRQQLENEKLWPGERVAGATYMANLIRTKREVDERVIHDTLLQRQRTAREKSEEAIWEQVLNIVYGFYALLTNMTSAAQVYTLFSGEDIFGKRVTLSDRILAAIDIAANAAGEAAGIMINLKRIKTAKRVAKPTRLERTGKIDRTKLEKGVDPNNVEVGTAVDPWDFGMLKDGTRHARFVADKFNVVIEIRPANLESMRWQGMGHPRKPEAIKQKTINALDVHLGASKDHIGLVGHFKPKKPVRPAGMDDATWAKVQKRYNQRLEAYDTFNPKMKKLEEAGQIKLEDGLIIDTGLCGDTKKAVTGDLDLWKIRDRTTGRKLSADEAKPVVDALKGGGFDAKHGAHTNWKPTDAAGKSIDAAIRKRHQQRTADNPDGGESILVIGGRSDGPARTTFSDAPHQTPGIGKTKTSRTTPTPKEEGRLPLTELRQGVEAAKEGIADETASEEIAEEYGPYNEQENRDVSEFNDYYNTDEDYEAEEWSPGDEEVEESKEESSSEEITEENGPHKEQEFPDYSEFDHYYNTDEDYELEEWSPGDDEGEEADEQLDESIDEDFESYDEAKILEDDIGRIDRFLKSDLPRGLSTLRPSGLEIRRNRLIAIIVGGLGLLVALYFGLRGILGEGSEAVPVVVETNTPTATVTVTPAPRAADYLEQLSRDPSLAGRIVTGRQLLQMGVPGADMRDLVNLFTPDDALDYVYSIEGISCGLFSNWVDMMYFLGGTVYLTEDAENPIYNDSLFECGQTGERTVVCPENVLPMPGGEMVVAVMVLAEPLPEPVRDPDPNGNPIVQPGEDQHIYAFVADTDGDPSNNFEYQSPYNWDYFQGTDVWYQLVGNPSSGTWIAVVGGPRYGSQVDSALRVVIERDTITFFIPANEFGDLDLVRYRLSAFQHDGSYRAAVSSGDVSGENPAQEPLPLIRTTIEAVGPSEDTLALLLPTPVPGAEDHGNEATPEPATETPQPTATATPTSTATSTATATPSPTPQPTATEPVLDPAEEQALAFLEDMGTAHHDGDSAFLYEHLHPAVLERYGELQCQLYLDRVTGSISELEALGVDFPVEFLYSTDGLETTLPDAVRLAIRYQAQGETYEGDLHILIQGGESFWFTDCGDPVTP